jgi:Flp pilus assembly protein TadD
MSIKRHTLGVIALTAAIAVASGCVGGSPFASRDELPEGPSLASRHADTAPTEDARIQAATRATESGGTNPLASATEAISASFNRATQHISDTLTVYEPIVQAPGDPLRLNSRPAELGPDLYNAAAKLAAAKGDFPAAERHFRKALEMDPNNTNAMLGLSRLKHRLGDLPTATRIIEQAARTAPDNPTVFNDLGLGYARQGMVPQAINALTRAVQLRPKSAMYRNNIATVLVEAGRQDEALEHLILAHGEAVASYNLGYLLYRRGDKQAAVPHFRTAVRIDPSLQPARQMLVQLTGSDGSIPLNTQSMHADENDRRAEPPREAADSHRSAGTRNPQSRYNPLADDFKPSPTQMPGASVADAYPAGPAAEAFGESPKGSQNLSSRRTVDDDSFQPMDRPPYTSVDRPPKNSETPPQPRIPLDKSTSGNEDADGGVRHDALKGFRPGSTRNGRLNLNRAGSPTSTNEVRGGAINLNDSPLQIPAVDPLRDGENDSEVFRGNRSIKRPITYNRPASANLPIKRGDKTSRVKRPSECPEPPVPAEVRTRLIRIRPPTLIAPCD